ncbi:unnamed protein product [Caenorhabditis bovis]|uniref:MADF domain-containing protein n=1 Tax=Caenorhabditis bovis TaxID=2654633 RepID=A0A8S1FBV4_9PELO|nr:unnamed protein product [Caenorhabditis bovis]
MALWTDPSRQFLISAIRSRPIIWDKNYATDNNYRNAKNDAIQEVVEDLNAMYPMGTKFSSEDVRSQWKNLKDTFVRKLRWLTEGKYSEDPTKEPTWKFYRMLSFLDEKETKRLHSEGIVDQNEFDLVQLHNDNPQYDNGRMHIKGDIQHQMHYEHNSHSAPSSEEQMLQMFSQSYESKQQGLQSVSPPSPSLPMPQVAGAPCSTETICAKPPFTPPNGHSSHTNGNAPPAVVVDNDDDEPRRKRVCKPLIKRNSPSGAHFEPYNIRRSTTTAAAQDEFDLFGACVAAQLRRLCEETNRGEALHLQKKLNDVIYESQIKLLNNQ